MCTTPLSCRPALGLHHPPPCSQPAEDFSFFGRAVPSTFLFLGTRNEALNATANLHSANFILDEDILPSGAALHASLAMQYLEGGGFGGAGAGAGSGSGREEL